jgi:hypothetical protein
LQAYKFFAKQFGLKSVNNEEVGIAGEIKMPEELTVGLPKDNLTIVGLARQLAAKIERPAGSPAARRAALQRAVRYSEVSIANTWALANSKNKGLETRSYRFDFNNGLSATAVWLRAIGASNSAPPAILLNDKGKKATDVQASDYVNRGEQALAVDLLFTGDAAPAKGEAFDYTQMLAATGDRPLGLEAAQLVAIAHWLRDAAGEQRVRLETSGIRSQLVAQVATAIAPGLFSELVVTDGMKSLGYLLEKPVEYQAAPDLFCLDLYKEFDIDDLTALAAPVKIAGRGF